MQQYPPGNWGRQILRAGLLLIGIALAARVIDALLAPVLPTAFALVAVGALCVFVMRRRR